MCDFVSSVSQLCISLCFLVRHARLLGPLSFRSTKRSVRREEGKGNPIEGKLVEKVYVSVSVCLVKWYWFSDYLHWLAAGWGERVKRKKRRKVVVGSLGDSFWSRFIWFARTPMALTTTTWKRAHGHILAPIRRKVSVVFVCLWV